MMPFSSLLFFLNVGIPQLHGNFSVVRVVGDSYSEAAGAGTFFLYLIYLGGVADASLNLKTIDYRTFCETAIPFTFDNMMPGRTNINEVNRSIIPEYDEPSDLFAQPEVPSEPQVAVPTEEQLPQQQFKNSDDNTNLSGKDHGSVRFASHVSTRSNTLQATSTPSLLPHHPQPSSRQSFSAKLTHFLLSAKMNSVAPLTGESMKANSRSMKVDQQMLIVAAGGILDQASEKALKEELGFDIEASEEVNLPTLEEQS
eukprot:gene325-350_t